MVDNYSPNSFDYENKKLDLENQLTEERKKISTL